MTALASAVLLVALVVAAALGADLIAPGPAIDTARAIPLSAGIALGGTLLAAAIGIPLVRLAAAPALSAIRTFQFVPALFLVLIAMGATDILWAPASGATRRVVMVLALGLVLWPRLARAGTAAAAAVAAFGVFADALALEATVSCLGLGLPDTLGALIGHYRDALGAPWPLILPGAALVALILLARLTEAGLHAARAPRPAPLEPA